MKKALVVDDTEVTRKVIAKMLERFGYESVESGDGQEALHTLKANPDVEIAFVDWNMPVMTGIELLHNLKKLSLGADFKVVMVTGNNEMEFVDSALEAGVDEYIMLPLTKEVFEEKLALIGIYPIE